MYSTSEQVYTAANNLTDNIGGFFSELLRLLFALIDTLIECAMYVFDCVTSNPVSYVPPQRRSVVRAREYMRNGGNKV